MLSAMANAQAHFECGAIACSPEADPFGGGGITGIDDLNVRGHLFDVSFTTTTPSSSPFVFSNEPAAPGQPLTGIDAGNAIDDFYAAIQEPSGSAGWNFIPGDPGPGFITAFAPAGALSSKYFGATDLWDFAQTFVGSVVLTTGVYGNNGFAANGSEIQNYGSGDYYTTWTPVAGPEIDPTSAGSGLLLLVGALTVLRGRRV